MNAVRLTPKRREWLAHLAKHGETPWGQMPKDVTGRRGCTNGTWLPMVDAGWITKRYGQRSFRDQADHLFTITDAGRAQLVQA